MSLTIEPNVFDPSNYDVIAKAPVPASQPNTTRAHVVTYLSLKGGVGTSALALAATARAAFAGKQVLAVDLDCASGDLALMAGMDTAHTLLDVVQTDGELDSDKVRGFAELDRRTGAHLLAAPRHPEDAELVIAWRAREAIQAATLEFDLVVLDTGTGFNELTLLALDASDEVVLVCEPSVTSIKSVALARDTIRRLRYDDLDIRIVCNERRVERGSLNRRAIERTLGARLDAIVPYDGEFAEMFDRGFLPGVTGCGSPIGEALAQLDHVGSPTEPAARRGLLRRFHGAD